MKCKVLKSFNAGTDKEPKMVHQNPRPEVNGYVEIELGAKEAAKFIEAGFVSEIKAKKGKK